MKFDAKKTIAALAMSATLFAMPVSALAVTVDSTGNLLTKSWTQMPAELHKVTSQDFTLTYTGVTDTVGTIAGSVTYNGNALAVNGTVPVTLAAAAGTTAPAGTVSFASAFANVDFATPGVYSFTLTENPTTNKNYSYNTANASYVVKVQVVYDDPVAKTVKVQGITVSDPSDNKQDENGGTFVNTAVDNAVLSLTKKVDGNQADTAKEFSFTVTLTGLEPNATYSYTNGGETTTFTADANGSATVSIDLHHDENVTINNLPDGATYTIKEGSVDITADMKETEGADGYKVTATGFDGNLANGETDTVTVTNTKTATTITGLAVTFLPYIGGLAAAGAGVGALVISRRHKKDADNF
ncbi:hypothetical protein QJ043_04820 [Olsenella sp. YH-ols2217]|uniref:DUF7601 domain-containing protein n=1 Tax=Kribbibacterium absianum TaxID=3044210 RepID=A0ABT6ZL52_9ACTN|nr:MULTISPECIES: DUF5979 domain-containing protein [unclassified Olsenella]MDJ1122930.1 hypothetical protein [Olsenella sp. YH-ols2216]MDJ1129401.1 hypothetical protein [Olsenella sp. YH-ols2217]